MKKGFTLIELLAVIVILAIIALIATPIVLSIIDDAKKSATLRSADFYLDGVETSVSTEVLNNRKIKDGVYYILENGNICLEDYTLENEKYVCKDKDGKSDNNELVVQVKGEKPNNGEIAFYDNKLALSVINGKYCITKEFDGTDILITEDVENCNIPVYTYTNGIMTSEDKCIKNGICEAGTAIFVQVNDEKSYKFRVLNDDGTTLKLIMSSNLYAEGNTTDPNVFWQIGNTINAGPIEALQALKARTSNWDNLDTYSYTLKDKNSVYTYSGDFVKDVRVSMVSWKDISEFIYFDNEMLSTYVPSWLAEGLYNTGDNNTGGYWLADRGDEDIYVWTVDSDGYIGAYNYPDQIFNSHGYGVRPVINIKR